MVSHHEVANAFVHGKKATGSRMFTDGKTIYSHGYHWKIAEWDNETILFNAREYGSHSTATHTAHVRRAIGYSNVIYVNDCDLDRAEETITDFNNAILYNIEKLARARTKGEFYVEEIKELQEKRNKLAEYKKRMRG